jgi:hypothetical protein
VDQAAPIAFDVHGPHVDPMRSEREEVFHVVLHHLWGPRQHRLPRRLEKYRLGTEAAVYVVSSRDLGQQSFAPVPPRDRLKAEEGGGVPLQRDRII